VSRKRRRSEWHAGELNLTAMIDVAFQLLNFFIITAHPVDVFANLDVFRPQAEKMISRPEEMPELLELMVYKDGYVLQKRNVDLMEMDRQLTKLAEFSKNVPLIIKCTGDSTHERLVRVLDLCSKAGFTKISVFSM
jgi:biopolymer transport protein ExbD